MRSIPSLRDWKKATSITIGKRGAEIAVIDAALRDYHSNPVYSSRRKLMILKNALELFMSAKNQKYGDYRKSKRHDAKDRINFETLFTAVIHQLRAHATTREHAQVRRVCSKLRNIKIADVDFSANVRAAAKRKMIGGQSLYDLAKSEWDDPNGWGHFARPIPGQLIDIAPRTHSERAMNQATMRSAFNGGKQALADIKKVAEAVKMWDYAVCESITSTVISD